MREERNQETWSLPDTQLPADHTRAKNITKEGVAVGSRVNITRNHWVPTIPGYGGYLPAKEAENIVGGGMTATCQLAARAIAERAPIESPRAPRTSQEDVLRARLVEFHHNAIRDRSMDERERLAKHLHAHCSGKIPGYMGHVPRKYGESVFGATMAMANRIAAEFCVDKVNNPEEHFKKICPQFPENKRNRK